MSQAKRTLSRSEIKQAILSDGRFRDLFPELKKEIEEIINNPACPCIVPTIDKMFQHKDRLKSYFSNREIVDPKVEAETSNQNSWIVINCHVSELEANLNKLAKIGRKQIAISRYEDQVTLVINDLGVMF